MDSSDPRTQPPQQQPQQQQRQPHPTQANPQPPPPQQQQQQLLQQPIIHPQHAQQNQSAGYAPHQHAYQQTQMQFHYTQPQYRHAYPQQYPNPHITFQSHYPQTYGNMSYQQTATWASSQTPFSNAPVSVHSQGLPIASKAPLVPREKKALPIIDPQTGKPINASALNATNKSQNDTNNKTKAATIVAPATITTTKTTNTITTTATSTVAKATSSVAAVATTEKTTTQQSISPATPAPVASKDSAKPVEANNATTTIKPTPVGPDRSDTSSPPSVPNILLQKVSEDSDVKKSPPVTPVVAASPTKPKDTNVSPPKPIEMPKIEAKKQESPAPSKPTTDTVAKTAPPKTESDPKSETDVKKDVVDNVKQEKKEEDKDAIKNDKKDDIQNDEDVKDDSTKDTAEADGEIALHYEPWQYNPTSNRNGKKKYSREFMVEVCEKICKLDIFNEGANENSLSNSYHQLELKIDMFKPPYQIPNSSAANRMSDPMRRQNTNNYMGRSSAGQERQRKIIAPSSSLTNEIELKTVSNPWRPGMDKVDKKEDIPLDAAEVEVLKKKFRSILNKLTPNNFDNLALAVTDLHIDTEQKLGEVIDIVFAKALAEPGYCVLYGRMCSHLKQITAGSANFGNTLLRRCQIQFNSDIYSGLNVDERKKKIEEEENAEVKRQLGEELYEEMYRCRMRGLGLIKFIGELYKIDMLNDSIMFDCIQRLLCDTSSEESLECLCDLLSTIGEKLDMSSQKKAKEERKNQKNAPKPSPYTAGGKSAASVVAANAPQKAVEPMTLDSTFEQLHKIRKNQELPISLRIRFKLLDVCELREKENWQSKNTKDNNPKKLEEIRVAHHEKLESERLKQAMGGRRSQEGRRLGHGGGSSNQLSSLGNDSGARGGMHGSASSQAIRDHERIPNYSDQHKREEEYVRNRESSKSILRNLSERQTTTESQPLRPMRFKQTLAPTNANSNSSSNSTSNTSSVNKAAASGSQ